MANRRASRSRETAETSIEVVIDLDGTGDSDVDTGIGFLDHMLESVATHGLFDLDVTADGDLEVDPHHTIEDVGIVLGEAFDDALADRTGIVRFADRRVPLDEALGNVVVDISGRAVFVFDGSFSQAQVGEFPSHLARHFWRSFVTNANITAHVEIAGDDAHHEIEALFKAFARALDDATRYDNRRQGTPSTKGEL